MGALPDSANFNIYEAQNTEYPSETFLVNKSTGRIEKIGGGMEAMEQSIDIILSVERYRYQIFTSNFGNELYKLIGKPREYVISMTKRRIHEAFSMDKRIISTDNFTFDEDKNGTIIKCAFDVKTVFGTTRKEVEI